VPRCANGRDNDTRENEESRPYQRASIVGPEPFVVSAVYDGARAPQNRCVLRPRRHGRAWSQDLGAGD
jgi:hypothetical protein